MIRYAFSEAHGVRDFLERHDAFWHWDNHVHVAQLTSGKLSDFFANCSPIYTDPLQQQDVGIQLARLIPRVGATSNQWIIGSAMGAVGLAWSLAYELSFRAAYTEPKNGEMELKRFDLGEKPFVVVCEDVMSTGGTTRKTINAIKAKHPNAKIHPVIPMIVDRRSDKGTPFLCSGFRYHVRGILSVTPHIWDDASQLPENMKNCIPIRPKGNWAKLQEKRDEQG